MKINRAVYIVGPDFEYRRLFQDKGWDIVRIVREADLLLFTGGEDIGPALYGEHTHTSTAFSQRRDEYETRFFNSAMAQLIPMVGICRGGQFLNVLSGGKLWQNVSAHVTQGTHPVTDLQTGEVFEATSTHHQMMIPGKEGLVLASSSICNWRERMSKLGEPKQIRIGNADPAAKEYGDPEVIWYPGTQCICFQPHPEYKGYDELKTRFFNYIDDVIFPMKGEPAACAV